MKKQTFLYPVLGAVLLVASQCAKRGSPSGGEKDITPPAVVKAEPPNNSLHFAEKKFRIYFNEYVLLKNIQQQLIVSPPLQYPPEIYPRGSASKFIEIKIRDTLAPNTTYVFNFGQSITDNNENNPYSFFSYIFSTGSHIDSLALSGVIKDALRQKPDNFVSVMLYEVNESFTDSVPYKKPPTYLTNTLDSTPAFRLTNLRPGKYLLLAIKDANNDYLFNPKTDKIAFQKEYIQLPSDSTYQLKLFKETSSYKAEKPILAAKNKIIFGYQGEPGDMQIELLTPTPEDFKYRIVQSQNSDSLYYWFTPIKADSLVFKVSHQEQADTFSVNMKELKADSLQLTTPIKGFLPLGELFTINANSPLTTLNKDKISLHNKDSAQVAFTTELNEFKNQLRLLWDVQPNERYKITLLPGALRDFFGNTHDTLQYELKTRSLADYGNIRVRPKNITNYPILLQLVTEKGEVVTEHYAETAREVYDFRNLEPAKYYIRVIFDRNHNKKWDTGKYLNKIQPEEVFYYPSVLEVRANWELEQEFSIH